MSSRFTVVPASYVILRRGNEVLLQLRQNTGYADGFWGSGAAGHIEAGESAFEAAQRETREELGVEVVTSALRPLCTMHRTARDGNPMSERIDMFFEAYSWHGTPSITEPDKVADLTWFGLDALPQAVVPHELFVLQRLNGDLPAVVQFGF